VRRGRGAQAGREARRRASALPATAPPPRSSTCSSTRQSSRTGCRAQMSRTRTELSLDPVHAKGGLVQVNRISVAFLVAGAAAVCAAGAASGSPAATVRVAYLSFAVANSYDAPMLAAAKAVAKANGASVTVLDAANDPKKQLSELPPVASAKQRG